jgi:hypothetical protein
MTRDIFEDYIAEISHLYTYDSYDLLRNNCNNFTQQASMFLTGNGIPDWISGLPAEVLATPFGRMIEPMISQWTNKMKAESMHAQGMDPSQFPATQAAFTQQFFPTASPAPSAPVASPIPATTPTASAQKSSVSISSNASPADSPHLKRQFLFADQRPTSFETVLKQLSLGDKSSQVVQDLNTFFDVPNFKSSLLPSDVLGILLEYSQTCALNAGFAPLFILRLLVLSESVNKAFSEDERGILILHRFLATTDAPVQAKAMALLVASNLFASKSGELLLLNSPHTTEWLATDLLGSTDQIRIPAAALLYNFALSLSKQSKTSISDHEDKFWQGVTLIAEILAESLKPISNTAALSATQEEFFWRVCSALFFFIESDQSAKEVAKQLELVDHLNVIKTKANAGRLATVTKDLLSNL